MTQPLTGLTPEEIATTFSLKPFQGRQIFKWLYAKQVMDISHMSDLSKALRQTLQEKAICPQLTVVQGDQSPKSGTKKMLFGLADGHTVESVLIRERDRITLCLSSQVGCPLKCSFCATGMEGFQRNLTPGEIVEQALHLLADENLDGRTPNIVYMGMGEPFCNYEAVVKSIHLLMADGGLAIGARKITVSTAGQVKEIERFAKEDWQVRLSISLHAANDTLRSELVPLNRKFPLAVLREAAIAYHQKTSRQITFEWTLMDGVNDTLQDAKELIEFIGGIRASVNLIPWNPVAGLPYAPTKPENAKAFCAALDARGIKVTLRKEQGGDIEAACGQLRRVHADAK
jgi:23S rRNA (adenine2503-C2)-methyltransferase